MIADLHCEARSVPSSERHNEPIDAAGTCRVQEGRPTILFEDWDDAGDWPGECVRPVPSVDLVQARRTSTEEFRALVRELHGASR